MRTITESESTPKADGFFMPAEFAPQDRVWMGWPHRTDTWAHGAKPAQKQYAAIARAISEFTPVYMCANQVDYANCKAVFENDENVTVIEMTTDDAWFRDTAATYARARSAPTTGTSTPTAASSTACTSRGTRTSRSPSRWLSSPAAAAIVPTT